MNILNGWMMEECDFYLKKKKKSFLHVSAYFLALKENQMQNNKYENN